ncbi:MAG TPA: zinc-ribbon domain-containing protein [Bryobacteraceae bacterium]|nr:zinc-ribbon domain-containing protein [Bryobacteraceae bacterium]
MYCGKCGTPNNESARFCERCGLVLGEQAVAAAVGGAVISPTVDVRVRGIAVAQPSGEKNPAVALILSLFIPGAGQFYNGDNKRGALMLGGALVSLLLAAFTIGVFTGAAIWIWSMVNAYNVASGKTARA